MSPALPRPDIFGLRAIRRGHGGIKTEGGSNESLSISAAVKVAEEEEEDLTVSVSERGDYSLLRCVGVCCNKIYIAGFPGSSHR